MKAATEISGAIHIVQRMSPGGIETLALDLVRSGPANDRIISLEGTAEELTSAWPALAMIDGRLEGMGVGGGIKPILPFRLARRLAALKPETVILHHIGPLVYGAAAARIAGVPRVIHVEHDVWHYAEPRRRLMTRLVEWAFQPHHVAVSEQASTTIRNFLPGAEVTVIPNGIDVDRFRPRDRIEARRSFALAPDWRIVGTAGRLVPVKGHSVLIAAVAHLPRDVHVVIAGMGTEYAALKQQAKDLGVSDRVHLLGLIDGVEALLPAFDVFCLPSHAEGFPRAIIEAQAVGLPVVATDVGALSEAACPETSCIVPAGNAIAMAHGITEMLQTSAGNEARQFVEERFCWNRTVAAYKQVGEAAHVA